MNEEKLKEAFKKVREDITYLSSEIAKIKQILQQLAEVTAHIAKNQAIRYITPTDKKTPAHQQPLEASESPNINVSIGNEGVPTDRQTNQQTDQHIENSSFKEVDKEEIRNKSGRLDHLQRASEILESLDELKKEVRFKFKRLTKQEMLIFSIIYQLEEEKVAPDYSVIAEKLHLSESSVRDYVAKIIKKGIPIEKTKESNKKVFLSISKDLKKIASLNTIVQLREL